MTKRRSNQHNKDQGRLFDVESQPDEGAVELSQYQRLEKVFYEAGFTPMSSDELSMALAALRHTDTAGGFAGHLNKVRQHQNHNKGKDNPHEAPLSIIKRVKSYADDAITLQDMLISTGRPVIEHLDRQGLNNGAPSLADTGAINGWRYESPERRALRALVVQQRVAGMSPEDKIGFDVASSDVDYYLESTPADIGVEQFDHAINTNDARANFWLKTIESARPYTVGSEAVSRAVEDLEKRMKKST